MLAAPSYAASTEYPLKAAFIYNIARMVEWPNETEAAATQAPVHMCFYGQDDFDAALDEYSSKQVRKRPVVILRGIDISRVAECQLIFISGTEQKNFPTLLQTLKAYAILTISEVDGFLEQGGMINLLLRDDKRLKIQVNVKATQQVGLNVSGRLLSAAEVVEGN